MEAPTAGAQTPATSQHYVAPDGALDWACWNGECVIYDRRSGDTHFLDIVGATLLRRLTQGPASLPALVSTVAELIEVPADAALQEQLRGLLAHFAELGLIDSMPEPA